MRSVLRRPMKSRMTSLAVSSRVGRLPRGRRCAGQVAQAASKTARIEPDRSSTTHDVDALSSARCRAATSTPGGAMASDAAARAPTARTHAGQVAQPGAQAARARRAAARRCRRGAAACARLRPRCRARRRAARRRAASKNQRFCQVTPRATSPSPREQRIRPPRERRRSTSVNAKTQQRLRGAAPRSCAPPSGCGCRARGVGARAGSPTFAAESSPRHDVLGARSSDAACSRSPTE